MAKRLLSLILIFIFLTQSAIPVSAAGEISPLRGGEYAQESSARLLNAPGSLAPITNLPVLKYLSLNPANPNNYFNFLLDKGNDVSLRGVEGIEAIYSGNLNAESRKLINYFFLGLTLPEDAFWVNLQPNQEDKLTSPELAKTDLGKILLEQDLKLKKDMANYLSPRNPVGKEYWEKLYERIEKESESQSVKVSLRAKRSNLGKLNIQTNNRVWIVPEKAVVVETEDGVLITEAKLKVMLEAEYFEHLRNGQDSSEVDKVKVISEQLMKEIIVPAITKDVNESAGYAPLRQIYHSLILAQYFKKLNSSKSYMNSLNSQNSLNSLNSSIPWSKDAVYQDYLKSYTQGEYKFIDKAIFNLKRAYFSGGIILDMQNFPVVSSAIKNDSSSDLFFNNALPVINAEKGSAAVNPKVLQISRDNMPLLLIDDLPHIKDEGLRKIVYGILQGIEFYDTKEKTKIEEHLRGVVFVAEKIKEKAGITDEYDQIIALAAILHDIGKQLIDADTLNKSKEYNDGDRVVIKGHASGGGVLLNKIVEEMESGLAKRTLSIAKVVARFHHERPSGAGYEGLDTQALKEEIRKELARDGLAGKNLDEVVEQAFKVVNIVAMADIYHAIALDKERNYNSVRGEIGSPERYKFAIKDIAEEFSINEKSDSFIEQIFKAITEIAQEDIKASSPVSEKKITLLDIQNLQGRKFIDKPDLKNVKNVKAGGIDLSRIELQLKDEKFASHLNPADYKIILAAKALKEGQAALGLLRAHEAMGLLRDDIVKSIRNKPLFLQLLTQLQTRNSLDPQGRQFLYLIKNKKSATVPA